MKASRDKCHLFLSTEESSNIQIANFAIKFSKQQGINLDNNLKFETQCSRKSRKLYGTA